MGNMMMLEKEKVTPTAAKAWREEHGISQATMAGLIGISYGAYSSFERGKTHELHFNTMERLVAVLRGKVSPPGSASTPGGGEVADLLAEGLENVAAKLRASGFSPATKAQIYEKAIRAAYETRLDAAAALRGLNKPGTPDTPDLL